jgi:hypothetical protein
LAGLGIIGIVIMKIPIKGMTVLAIFLAGMALDLLSTYLCAKIAGMPTFYCCEENKIAKICVKKFGLGKGLLISEIHPESVFFRLWIIGTCGSLVVAAHGYTGLLNIAIPGMLFLGIARILASINNFNELRLELQPLRTLDEI